jgi:hypothetical protein
MKKLLVRFEDSSNKHQVLVIDEVDKYLGVIDCELVKLIWTTDDIVEEEDYHYFWCHKDLMEQYLIK